MELEAQPLEPQQPIAEGQAAPEQSTPEVPTPESEAQAPQPPKKEISGVEKRINQLTWKAHEAERRANAAILAQQEAEQRAWALWQQQQEIQRQATMPTLEQHNLDPVAFQRAVEAHNQRYLEQQRQVQQQAWQNQQQRQAHEQFQRTLVAKAAEGAEKFADYNEVVGNPSLPPLASNPPLLAALLEHEQFAELSYYLGKNPAEAHRIVSLPPARAVMEMGKIAARLPTNSRQTSNAPAPPAQVGGNQSGSTKDPSRMSYDEFVAFRRKQIAARRN